MRASQRWQGVGGTSEVAQRRALVGELAFHRRELIQDGHDVEVALLERGQAGVRPGRYEAAGAPWPRRIANRH